MSKLERILRSYDDADMASNGDPARYRRRVAELLSFYDRVIAGERVTPVFAREMLDRLTFVFGNLIHHCTIDVAAREVFATMRSEMPELEQIESVLNQDICDLYDNAERTQENVSHLQARAALQMAVRSSKIGLFVRLMDREYAYAKRMYEFARLWLNENYGPSVQYDTVYYESARAPYTPIIGMPTYSGL